MAAKALEYTMIMETPFSSQKWDVSSKEESRIRRSLTFRAKASLLVALVIAAVIVSVVVVCFVVPAEDEDFWPAYRSESTLGRYRSAAVSTDAAPCAPVGKSILSRGGSAVDAAIAVLVCMGAHNPQSMGLGGGFLMLYYNRSEQRAYYIDAREVAPRKATEDMFQGNATNAAEGGLSIAVPGELAGYWEAHRQFGRLPWGELFAPTIHMCRRGVEVSEHLARTIRKTRDKMMTHYKDLGQIFLKNGTDAYSAGERIVMEDLAHTLQAIAEDGMRALYGPGKLADNFLADLQNAGSIIDRADLQSYSPRMREPVSVRLRGNTTVFGVSPPGSGALLTFMLSVLDGYPGMDASAAGDRAKAALAYHRMVEAMKFGYARRSHMEDEDSEEMEQLLARLTSRDYADAVRRRISDSRTSDDPSFYGDPMSYAEDHGTAHLSLVAPDGDAVAVTSTVNQYFGSKVVSPSTGIVLNDEMDDFSSPNITNMFELPPSPANRIRPGRRPMSSMTPVVAVDAQGDVRLVLGGNGGTTITSGVLQVAVKNLFFGEDIKKCIDAPRIHHQLTPNIMHYENRFPTALADEMRRFGHHPELWTMGMMSIIIGVERGADGHLYANSDYRKGGEVDGF